MNELNLRSQKRCFDGTVGYYSHSSQKCQCEMNFAIYLPPQAKEKKVPILYYLSGLTCTEDNFTTKAGAQRWAAELGIAIAAPDTSPRNTRTPGEDDDWDLGTGAAFYVDATRDPWQQHYQMYSYVTEEFPSLIAANFPIDEHKQSICGHSMGGHGALICAFKNPSRYRCVSALAPIAAPIQCPWGEKAFSHYLGDDKQQWRAYDASELVKTVQLPYSILIDQGDADNFLAQKQLLPDVFAEACDRAGQALNLRYQPGYDHSYFFVATFIEDHLRFHAAALFE